MGTPWDKDFSWTDERVALLKDRWLNGRSCSQIAKELGNGCADGPTRSAVIGKVHRLGLSRMAAPSLPSRNKPDPAVAAQRKRRAVLPAPAIVVIDAAAPAVPGRDRAAAERQGPVLIERHEPAGVTTMLEVGPRQCKWPIGDPMSEHFTLCGLHTGGGYCAEHARIAYAAPKPGRPRTGKELERALRKYI